MYRLRIRTRSLLVPCRASSDHVTDVTSGPMALSVLIYYSAMANIHIMDQDLSLLRYFLIITIVKLQYNDHRYLWTGPYGASDCSSLLFF